MAQSTFSSEEIEQFRKDFNKYLITTDSPYLAGAPEHPFNKMMWNTWLAAMTKVMQTEKSKN